MASLAVGIGVPILLFYVYGVVPVSLCRSGGCGVTTSSNGVHFDFDEEHSAPKTVNIDYFTTPGKSNLISIYFKQYYSNISLILFIDGDTVSHGAEIGNPSIGEPSFWNEWEAIAALGRDADQESASTVALAGSLLAQK